MLDIKISKEQARQIAYSILYDIDNYVIQNKEKYEKYLNEKGDINNENNQTRQRN